MFLFLCYVISTDVLFAFLLLRAERSNLYHFVISTEFSAARVISTETSDSERSGEICFIRNKQTPRLCSG